MHLEYISYSPLLIIFFYSALIISIQPLKQLMPFMYHYNPATKIFWHDLSKIWFSTRYFLSENHRMLPITYTKNPNSFMWYKEPAMIWTLTFFSSMAQHISITIYMPLLQSDICISPSLFDVLHFQDNEHALHYAGIIFTSCF